MYIYKTDMRNVRNFNVRKRHLNMQGKNIMNEGALTDVS